MSLHSIIDHTHYEEDLGSDWNWDSESITKANGFFYQLAFLLCFKILLEVLSSLRELTMKLQMQAVDVYRMQESHHNTHKNERRLRKRIFEHQG